jgi:hypothetical protein
MRAKIQFLKKLFKHSNFYNFHQIGNLTIKKTVITRLPKRDEDRHIPLIGGYNATLIYIFDVEENKL